MKQNDFLTGKAPNNNSILLKGLSMAALLLCPILNSYSQTNVALTKNAVASSTEWDTPENISAATDGNLGTRWANNRTIETGDSWIYVDLLDSYNINKVVLNWETASAKGYKVQISEDTNFTEDETIKLVTDGDGGTDDLTVSGSGRYLRIYCTEKNTVWGYSLYEIEAYGNLKSSLGVNDIDAQIPSVGLYPNPAQDYVQVSFPEQLNNAVITVHDLLGKSLIQTKVDDSTIETQIDINHLSKGTYILNIKADGKNWSKKLVKE